MKTEQLALFLISPDSTVVEAMQRIDRNARGILFVTNEQQKLLGVVTDGRFSRDVGNSLHRRYRAGNRLRLSLQRLLHQGDKLVCLPVCLG